MDKKREDKLIKTSDSRTRLNLVGAIRLEHSSEAVIQQYYKTVNSESIVDFLTKPQDFYSTNVTSQLVFDGAGYHRSGLVIVTPKSWIAPCTICYTVVPI
jgi:hypothetical protein